MFYRFFVLLLLLPALHSCAGRGTPHQHSFYYWKTSFPYTDTATEQKIQKMGVNHFYIRYLDVDWNEALDVPMPKGQLTPYNSGPFTAGKYTPVIFITNRTFERISDAWIDSLAAKITKSVDAMNIEMEKNVVLAQPMREMQARHHGNERTTTSPTHEEQGLDTVRTSQDSLVRHFPSELQIDCDWTATTRDKYFRFLEKLKVRNPGKTISVTVRLYPYKYRKKMGIPPADRGMLMCYNMGNIKSENTRNSIFDLDEMNKYLDDGSYPLPLDIALPIFSWQVWFRGGKFKAIVHNAIYCEGNSRTFTRLNDNYFRINIDTVINDAYYREGDEIRTEAPDAKQLLRAADLLTKKIPGYGRLTFFDWDNNSIVKYEQTIQAVFNKY